MFKAGDVILIKEVNIDKTKLENAYIAVKKRIRMIQCDDVCYVENSIGNCVELSLQQCENIYGIDCLEMVELETQLKKRIIEGLCILLVILSIYCTYLVILYHCFKIQFTLNTENVTLHVNDSFNPDKFIKELENAKVITPIFKTDKTGTFDLEYVAYNRFFKETRNLNVNVVDDQAPTLLLSTHEIDENDFDSCRSYILEAIDDIDGNIKHEVVCNDTLAFYDGKAEVEYTLLDSSNNMSKETLTVIRKDVEPVIEETPVRSVVYTKPQKPKPDLSNYILVPSD